MNRKQLIQKYIEFFKSKNHKEIPNSSLVPKEDPTVLFTTAGMHPLVPYLLGQKHPLGKKLVGVQKCVRTGDIDEVGDETHHTFFEMLGNWSLGDYWKKEAIEYSFEFLTKILKIKKEKLEVSCFKGDKDSPKDVEAEKIWGSLGISKIKFLGKEDNWWGPAGETGPCGPDTEMFVNNVEIWNDVFMEYEKNKNGGYSEAKQKNIDTGMGVERTLAVLNNLNDNYKTEVWKPIIDKIEKLSGKKYKGNEKAMRIIADHVKASVFIIADGIIPSNKEQGYVLRKLIRRAVRYGKELGLKNFTNQVAEIVFEIYENYLELKKNKIRSLEENNKTLTKQAESINKEYTKNNNSIIEEKTNIEHLKIRLEELKAQIAEIVRQKSDFIRLKEEYDQIKLKIEMNADIDIVKEKEFLNALKISREEIKEQIIDIQKMLTENDVSLKDGQKLKEEIELNSLAIKGFEKEKNIYNFLCSMFGEKGIQSSLVENEFSKLEDITNMLLDKLGMNMTIELKPHKELKKLEEACSVCGEPFFDKKRTKYCTACGTERKNAIKSHKK